MSNKPKRDARVDPKPGDIIRFGGTYGAQYHEVLAHDPQYGMTDVSSFSDGIERQRSIRQWRKFAKQSEVLRAVR